MTQTRHCSNISFRRENAHAATFSCRLSDARMNMWWPGMCVYECTFLAVHAAFQRMFLGALLLSMLPGRSSCQLALDTNSRQLCSCIALPRRSLYQFGVEFTRVRRPVLLILLSQVGTRALWINKASFRQSCADKTTIHLQPQWHPYGCNIKIKIYFTCGFLILL